MNEVIKYLIKNGVMSPKELFQEPFTLYNDAGVTGVMGDVLAKKVVALVEHINKNAEVA